MAEKKVGLGKSDCVPFASGNNRRQLLETGNQKALKSSADFVKIDLVIELIARQQKRLRLLERSSVDSEGSDLRVLAQQSNADMLQQPGEVDRARARTGHETISPDIVQPISVKCTGDDSAPAAIPALAVKEVRNPLRSVLS